jgi:diacylglycerol kinase (ATP)
MIVLLNKNSSNKHGLQKWENVRPELEEKYLGHDYRLIFDAQDLTDCLSREPAAGAHTVVAAGGDGTVNFLLNQLMKLEEEERRKIVMGAVGLGSSNDFHKPFSAERRVNGRVYFKLDEQRAIAHNIGLADYEDARGQRQVRYFIINSSVGIIAQANYFFNSGNRLVNWLKPRCVLGAIYYAAIKTILSAQNIPAEIIVDGQALCTDVTTLSVVINPHFSGNLSYDLKINPQSDFLGVALCEGMGITERLRTMISLAQSKFQGMPKTRSWKARNIEIRTNAPTALELDGEVCLARDIRIRLLQGYLRVCQ